MKAEVISDSILNEIEDVVYIADPKTYEVYYINASGLQTLGNPPESVWRREKCYKVLQGRDEPCPFCTNDKLVKERFYNWEHYNSLLDKYFDIQDKLVVFEGIEARMEIAKDVTRRKHLEQNLTQQLEEQQMLNSCIAMLHTADAPSVSIHKLLELIAGYHQAERGYIFELSANGTMIDNTYEWCAQGVEPQIDVLQQVDASIVDHWFEKFEVQGEFYIDSVNEDLDRQSTEYEILAAQGIAALVTAPLRNMRGEITGFLGVDNPKKNAKNTFVIRAAAKFVLDFLDKNDQMERLNRLSFYDSLTGLKNRHSYSEKIAQLRQRAPSALGIIYVDINGLKTINDKLGHKEGDRHIKLMAELLNQYFGGFVFRIGGDEFVIFCSDMDQGDFTQRLNLLQQELVEDGVPKAALGYSWRGADCNTIDQIEEADHRMLIEKDRQYAAYMGKVDLFRRKHTLEMDED